MFASVRNAPVDKINMVVLDNSVMDLHYALLQPGLSGNEACIYDSLLTIFWEHRMNIFIKDARTLWVAAAIVLGAGTMIGGVHAQQSTDKAEEAGKATSAVNSRPPSLSGKREGEMIAEVPVVVMVPMQASNDLAMEKGCWAKLYDKKNFQGDNLLLVGPINLARMLGPFGVNWENKVRSIETGPRTNLTIFDNRNFGDEDKFIEPNVKIPDLSRKMGFFDNFRSLMLSCI